MFIDAQCEICGGEEKWVMSYFWKFFKLYGFMFIADITPGVQMHLLQTMKSLNPADILCHMTDELK